MSSINPYSAGIPYIAPNAATGKPEIQYASGEEYKKMLDELEAKNVNWAVDPSTKLYNGSTTRAKLSDAEIAVLANKYNVRDMSDDEFDAFLDDLESMGAISPYEKGRFGYKNTVLVNINEVCAWMAPMRSDGSFPIFDRKDANGDILKWLNDRMEWKRSGSNDPVKEQESEAVEEAHKALAAIVGRMGRWQESDAKEAEKKELVRQLADKNSDFYTNMRTQLKAQVKKNDEDREEQAIIDAMAAVLDAMSGRETVAGEKVSVNKSASDLTKKIGEKISRLRQEDPDNPEIVKLENMLKRFQEMGIYIDLGDTDDLWQDEDETFETLTQLLIRRQAEEINTEHPNEKEVNEPA